ncbi:hypothetical protein BDQ94DRAFT_183260 [Aspergillus welwitschiae]|uniref:Uncharacterized protein n=1 Tax=Aspergillus welwitschiae TaxID=1341132 RepID=A0A3F3PPN4_9EURO|nr:hypothetical protein BDQ94DRAFT_183260 [Aspergillus welwitschiae]RDH28803.1 hypothetical protein BDQ94DRAFT_183260 [Aspergillus welwitschiae]
MIDTCRPALVSLVARWPLGGGCRMHIALWHDRAEQRSGDELEVPVVSLGLSQRRPPPRVTAASGWMSANNRFPSLEEVIDGIDKRSTDWGVCPSVSGGVCQPGMVGLATTTASGSYKGKQEQPEELFHPVSFLDSRTVGACVSPSIHTNFPSWMRKAHVTLTACPACLPAFCACGDTPITHETAVRQTTSYSRQSASAEWDDGYLSYTIDNNSTLFASEIPSFKQSLNQELFLGNPCDSRRNRNRYPCLIHPYSNGVNSGTKVRKKDVRLPPRQQRRIHGRIGPLHPRPPTRAILPRHENPSNLLDIYRTTKPPYFWHHIRPERQRWGINEIARNASPLTRPLFARGMTSGEYGPNWVAGWLLYSVFRSRDVRNNRNRRLLKDKNGNGGISGGSGEGRASPPQMVLRYDGGASAGSAGGSGAANSGKKEYYDPVRNG